MSFHIKTILFCTTFFGVSTSVTPLAVAGGCEFVEGTGTVIGIYEVAYVPADGTSMRCARNLPEPSSFYAPYGILAPNSNNVTVHNEINHTLEGEEAEFNLSSSTFAVFLGENANFLNDGRVRSGSRFGNNAHVINSETGTFSSADLGALRVGDYSYLENSGQISSSSANGINTPAAALVGNGSTVLNTATGAIRGSGAGVSIISAGDVTTLTNQGYILVDGASWDGFRPAAVLSRSGFGENDEIKVFNSGTLESRDQAGIWHVGGGTFRLENSGKIKQKNESFVDHADEDQAGVLVELVGRSLIIESGQIASQTIGAKGQAFILNTNSISAQGHGVALLDFGETCIDRAPCEVLSENTSVDVTNFGDIIGDVDGNDRGDGIYIALPRTINTANGEITFSATAATILQMSGKIVGDTGIQLSDGDDIVSLLGGEIIGTGGTAIDFGGGDDVLIYNGLGTATGAILGGSGLDTLELVGGGAVNGAAKYGGTIFQASGDIGAGFNGFETMMLSSGAWTLTGASAFDNTQVNGDSMLTVNGSLDGAVTIGANGLLNGLGTINGNVLNNGTIGSTGTPGVLTINGDLTSNGTIVIDLGVNRLVVSGDALLNAGSTLAVNIGAAVTAAILDQPIEIIDVGGTLTNNAENVINVQDPGFLFDLMLRNVNGNLVVELAFQDLSELSDDPNLSVFGQALEDTFRAGSLDPAIVQNLNAVQGEAQYGDAVRGLTPSLLYGSARQLYMTSVNQMPGLDLTREASDGLVAWADGGVAKRQAGSDGPGFPGYDAKSTYGAIGVDYPAGPVRLGLSAALGQLDIDENSAQADIAEATTSLLSVYGRTQGMSFDAQVSAGWMSADYDAVRGSFGNSAISGDYKIDGYYGQIEVSKTFTYGATSLRPSGLVRMATLKTDSFKETGGLNLTVNAEDVKFFDIKAGAEVAHRLSGMLEPFASVDVTHDLNSDAVTLTAVIPNGSSFDLTRGKGNASRADIAAGLRIGLSPDFTGHVAYQGFMSSDEQSHGVAVGMKMLFD